MGVLVTEQSLWTLFGLFWQSVALAFPKMPTEDTKLWVFAAIRPPRVSALEKCI